MEDRIQINGEWYVKENNTLKTNKDGDMTFFEGCVYETDNYCWKATRIYESYAEKTFYPNDFGIDIKFTDKTQKPFKSEHWDNTAWFNGILNEDDEVYLSALELMGVEGVNHFKAFLKKLVEINYL